VPDAVRDTARDTGFGGLVGERPSGLHGEWRGLVGAQPSGLLSEWRGLLGGQRSGVVSAR
jgi:hypothetical protein